MLYPQKRIKHSQNVSALARQHSAKDNLSAQNCAVEQDAKAVLFKLLKFTEVSIDKEVNNQFYNFGQHYVMKCAYKYDIY